jgi:hypothetical protein
MKIDAFLKMASGNPANPAAQPQLSDSGAGKKDGYRTMIERFENIFRITLDEQGDPKIDCRNGFGYEIGEMTLGVWLNTKSPNLTFKKLVEKFPKCYAPLQGDWEIIIALPVGENADEAIAFLKAVGAHRKRRISDVCRAALIERGKEFLFQPGHGAGSVHPAPESTRAAKR